MPTKPKNKPKSTQNSKEALDVEVGSIHEELEVPVSTLLFELYLINTCIPVNFVLCFC